MNRDRVRVARLAAMIAAVGGTVLGFILLTGGIFLAVDARELGPLQAGGLCLLAALLLLARRFLLAALVLVVAGVLVLPTIRALEADGLRWTLLCWLLAVISPWWGPR